MPIMVSKPWPSSPSIALFGTMTPAAFRTGAIAAQAQAIKGRDDLQSGSIGWNQPDGTQALSVQGTAGPDIAVCLPCRGNPAFLRVQADLVALESRGALRRPEMTARAAFGKG